MGKQPRPPTVTCCAADSMAGWLAGRLAQTLPTVGHLQQPLEKLVTPARSVVLHHPAAAQPAPMIHTHTLAARAAQLQPSRWV
jgi:hypothetical protein